MTENIEILNTKLDTLIRLFETIAQEGISEKVSREQEEELSLDEVVLESESPEKETRKDEAVQEEKAQKPKKKAKKAVKSHDLEDKSK